MENVNAIFESVPQEEKKLDKFKSIFTKKVSVKPKLSQELA